MPCFLAADGYFCCDGALFPAQLPLETARIFIVYHFR